MSEASGCKQAVLPFARYCFQAYAASVDVHNGDQGKQVIDYGDESCHLGVGPISSRFPFECFCSTAASTKVWNQRRHWKEADLTARDRNANQVLEHDVAPA